MRTVDCGEYLEIADESVSTKWYGLRWSIGWILSIVLFVGFGSAEARQPNILFIMTDDQRPDTIAALGNPAIRTPNLDGLVQGGTAFTRAIAAYPVCHVSRAEVLTGTSAFRNGIGYHNRIIDPVLATWAGTFRAAGYQTWFVGKWHNDGQPKQRGYEETHGLYTAGGGGTEQRSPYLDHAGSPGTGYTGWTFKTDDGKPELEKGIGLTSDISRYFADAAIEFIERKTAEPFFLHVAFTAPHDPRILPPSGSHVYVAEKMILPKNFRADHPFDHGNFKGRDEVLLAIPRQPEEVRAELAAYYAVISALDEQIGRMIAALKATGQLENTLIIFTTDQGLALGSHGLMGKQNMYEHTLGVPLIFNGPGVPKGGRRETACYLRDLFPTACEFVGITIPESVEARSLMPALRDARQSIHPNLVSYFTDTQRAIREGPWKLVLYLKANQTQLFDLANDPDEIHDLSAIPEKAARIADLRGKLTTWLTEHADPNLAAVLEMETK